MRTATLPQPQRLTAEAPARTASISFDLKIVLLLLCHSLVRSFFQFFGGPEAPSNALLSGLITATPFLLGMLWLTARVLARQSPAIAHAPTRPVSLAMRVFLYLFGIVLLYAAYNGLLNRNEKLFNEIYTQVILWSSAVIAFSAVRSIHDVRRLMRWFFPVLFLLAALRFLQGIIAWFDLQTPFFDAWTNGILIALGYCLFLSRFLVKEKTTWKDLAALFIFTGSLLVTFHKPMVWSTVITTAVMVGMAFWKRGAHAGRRLLYAILITALFVILADLLTGGAVFAQYRADFYRLYLKIDEATGRPLGTSGIHGGRLYIWEDSLHRFAQRPLFGEGLGVGSRVGGLTEDVAIHNVAVYFLLATGTVGSIVTLGLFFSWLRPVLRSLRRDKDLVLTLGLFGYVTFILAFGMVGTIWVVSSVTYMLGITLGLTYKIALLKAAQEQRT
jgi:hypothetical protein